jgi:hypothetical protein
MATAPAIRAGSWGLRLHPVAILGGPPVGFAVTGVKADKRQTLLGILAADRALAAGRRSGTTTAPAQQSTAH